MQLRFVRDRSISVREQLATQMMLAIASGELPRGKRLPSIRALAKRFRLHPNTVSAVYQQLESSGWVVSAQGSGIYVRPDQPEPGQQQEQALDHVVLGFLRTARTSGLSSHLLRKRLDYWLGPKARRFLFVHPDAALREIVCRELRRELEWKLDACEATEAAISHYEGISVLLTVPSKEAEVRRLSNAATEVLPLQIRPVARSLEPYLPVRQDVLTVVASAWPDFLEIARTVLIAAGYDPEALIFRDARNEGWTRGLGPGSAVICDVVTAANVPVGVYTIPFPLISDPCIAGLKAYEQFFRD